MAEIVQLLPEPDPARDEAIFRAWRKGQSVVKLARDYDLPQSQVTVILDRYLPSLTPAAQVRELRKLLFDLEELRAEFQDVAMTEHDADAANVSVRVSHEIAMLRQFVGGGQHNDPIQLTQRASVNSRESSTAALQRGLDYLCGKRVNSPDALPVPDQGDQEPQR